MMNDNSVGYKFIDDKSGVLSCLGLFVPVPTSGVYSYFKGSKYGWVCTITLGYIPIGWVMVVIALIF